MKGLNTITGGHLVDCTGLIWGIYTDIVVSYVHMNVLVHVACVGFKGHISFWHMLG